MLLAVDIGNTNIVIGVFDHGKLKATWRCATDVHETADEYASVLLTLLPRDNLSFSDIDAVIIASVVPPLVTTFEALCERYFKITPLVVDAGVKTGVRVRMDNPKEVGADRIVNAVAAHKLYGGTLIIIDFGTATTFDVVSREGDYLGGVIAPGIGIAAEVLFERTAKLPRVELVAPKKAIGKNTVASMQSGIIFGYVGLVEAIVARISKELPEKPMVIATGGLGEMVAKQTGIIEAVDPDLTLVGLRLIHELNSQHP